MVLVGSKEEITGISFVPVALFKSDICILVHYLDYLGLLYLIRNGFGIICGSLCLLIGNSFCHFIRSRLRHLVGKRLGDDILYFGQGLGDIALKIILADTEKLPCKYL